MLLVHLPNRVCVAPEGLRSLLLDLALLIRHFLLLLDHVKELIALSLRLLGEHNFPLHKLLPASKVEILSLLALKLSLFSFLSAGFSLAFLKGTLCSESVNLSLSVCGPLLKLTQPLDL